MLYVLQFEKCLVTCDENVRVSCKCGSDNGFIVGIRQWGKGALRGHQEGMRRQQVYKSFSHFFRLAEFSRQNTLKLVQDGIGCQ